MAQVERLCYMLTELSVIVNEEKDCAIMLEKNLATVASLAVSFYRIFFVFKIKKKNFSILGLTYKICLSISVLINCFLECF